ncbi:MAG: hypothetical protein J6B81_04110 [Spirochaetaceae bacterium]|nr:hypothetical protein [Spirochaetaceae bacterium]
MKPFGSFNKIQCAILPIFFAFTICVSAETFFNGYSGAVATIQPIKDQKPELTAQAFFTGQFDISGLFQIRAELSINTEDIINNGLFQNTPAFFTINELSATAKIHSAGTMHLITAFAGSFESIGSDLFLRRMFGIQPVGAKLTESWLGLNSSSIYSFSGLGLAYGMKLNGPHAFGAYIYRDKTEKNLSFNGDVRYAGIFDFISIDAAFGIGLPFETEDSAGNNVILLIRTVDLHGGITLLIGNRYTTSIFLQGGIKQLRLNPNEEEKVLKLSDLYFILEPRFTTKNMHFHFSLFNIPETMAKDLFYISNPLGCNLSIFSDKVQLGKLNLTVGGHLTLSATNTTLENFNEISNDSLELQIAPFASTELFGGILNLAAKIDVLNIINWHESFQFIAGYKVQL